MQASDIAAQLPTVTLSDPVTKAVTVMATAQMPGLIVVDEALKPRVVLPGTQVLRLRLLRSYQRDQALARTIDEAHADLFWEELGARSVSDCLPAHLGKPWWWQRTPHFSIGRQSDGWMHCPLVAVGTPAAVSSVLSPSMVSSPAWRLPTRSD